MTDINETGARRLFNPPLSRQRYDFVIDFINKSGCQSVIDLGCSEMSFFLRARNFLKHVISFDMVDFNKEKLINCFSKAYPLMYNYSFPPANPLSVRIFCGNVTKSDLRLLNKDVVTAIEIIEHLPIEHVALFTENLFGFLKPKYVVITTPNFDFNIHFSTPPTFRNIDHKFEWTRSQFKEFCFIVSERYGYDFIITGVGVLNQVSTFLDLGFCTQIAVFTKRDFNNTTILHLSENLAQIQSCCTYELIKAINYPTSCSSWNHADNTIQNIIDVHVNYFINSFVNGCPNDHTVEDVSCINMKIFYYSSDEIRQFFPNFFNLLEYITFHTSSRVYNKNNWMECCFVYEFPPKPATVYEVDDNLSDEDYVNSSEPEDIGELNEEFQNMNIL